MQYTFGKEEKLKKRSLIGQLFEDGDSFFLFPYKVLYLKTEIPVQNFPCQTGIAVSKRNIRRAVGRNKIKRLFREAFRLQKRSLYDALKDEKYLHTVLWVYVGKESPDYHKLHKQTGKCIERLINELTD